MFAIAVTALFVVFALASLVTIAASVTAGIAAGREMLAELSGAAVGTKVRQPASLPPLRGRRETCVPSYSRQAVRLRPLRPSAAAA